MWIKLENLLTLWRNFSTTFSNKKVEWSYVNALIKDWNLMITGITVSRHMCNSESTPQSAWHDFRFWTRLTFHFLASFREYIFRDWLDRSQACDFFFACVCIPPILALETGLLFVRLLRNIYILLCAYRSQVLHDLILCNKHVIFNVLQINLQGIKWQHLT